MRPLDTISIAMTLEQLLTRARNGEPIAFADTLAAIAAHYAYRPASFRNGPVENAAGQNEGSCKLLAFARLRGLTQEQTLALFGEHYRDVLADPDGSGHANIRAFMRHSWEGVEFAAEPLTPLAGS